MSTTDIDYIDGLLNRLEDKVERLQDFRIRKEKGDLYLEGKCLSTNTRRRDTLPVSSEFHLFLCKVLNTLGCDHDSSKPEFRLECIPSQETIMKLLVEAKDLSNVYIHNLLLFIREHGYLDNLDVDESLKEISCHHLEMATNYDGDLS